MPTYATYACTHRRHCNVNSGRSGSLMPALEIHYGNTIHLCHTAGEHSCDASVDSKDDLLALRHF